MAEEVSVEQSVKINKWDGTSVKYTIDDTIRKVCAFCSIGYFSLITILQAYMMYVEKNVFYQGIENNKCGIRVWCFSGDMARFDDKYTLSVSYRQGNSSGSAEVTKSVANYVTEDGEIIVPALTKEVQHLYQKLSKRE